MKLLITLAIALALAGCSDDDTAPIIEETICDNPTGIWYATIVWGQGTCTLSTPSAEVDLSIAKAADGGYAVHSTVGDGTLKARIVDGACTLSVEMSQATNGYAWTMDIKPENGGSGSGLFAVTASSGNCIHAFTVTHYEER